jgi:dTDP-4-amino-4,6-dideoxygalactose transaminase
MDGIQAAVLRVKLKDLDEGNAARRANALRYDRLLSGLEGVVTLSQPANGTSAHHLYVVRVQRRDSILAALGKKGIACGIHYPVPIHLQEAYRFLGLPAGSFPVAERCAGEILSLPMFPQLTALQIETIVDELASVLAPGKVAEAGVA